MFWMYLPKHVCFCQLFPGLVKRKFSLSFMLGVDYYKILGVSSTASSDEIKKAYLRKCKEYHPDRHQGSKHMQEKFVKVNEAYNVLSNAAERQEHDNRTKWPGSRPSSSYGWGRGPRASPEDVYRQYQWERNNSHQNYQKQNQSRQEYWTYRDPMSRYWDKVYKNHSSGRDDYQFTRSNPFQIPKFQRRSSQHYNSMQSKEKKYLIIFFTCLIFIIYVRVFVAAQTMHQNSIDPNFPSSFPQKSSPKRKDSDDLNLKTEDT